MSPSDPPLALLSRALTALWLETIATQPSGALAVLEPRIAKDGPRCMTDGETLWVDAWAMQEWLREPSSERGRKALAAAGLELLYHWRNENGPWIIPGTPSDTVITSPPRPDWGDWVLGVQHPRTRAERDQELPNSSWMAGVWWKEQPSGVWLGALGLHEEVQIPGFWEGREHPSSLTLSQAQSIWRECVRDLRDLQGPAEGEAEKQWMDDCLQHHPDELDAWMALQPPMPVPRNALFYLKDPKWVGEFLQRGAQADALLAGSSVLQHAGQTAPHMVQPLWEAGLTPQGVPVTELLVMVIIGSHHSDEAVVHAGQAARFLMDKLAEAGTPFDWHGHLDLLAPIFPSCLLGEERRVDILAHIWPDGLELCNLVPTLKIRDANGREETWPLPLALGALAAEGLTRGTTTPGVLEERLDTLQRLGVRFCQSHPEGGVYHAALLHTHEAEVAREIQRLFSRRGADWNAVDKHGKCARSQKAWGERVMRERQHAQIPWDELEAVDLAGHMKSRWGDADEGEPRVNRRGRL